MKRSIRGERNREKEGSQTAGAKYGRDTIERERENVIDRDTCIERECEYTLDGEYAT